MTALVVLVAWIIVATSHDWDHLSTWKRWYIVAAALFVTVGWLYLEVTTPRVRREEIE